MADMRCPLRFGKCISERDEECQADCAWLMKRARGNGRPIEACAAAVLASRISASGSGWAPANR